jgi:hypothetical protein
MIFQLAGAAFDFSDWVGFSAFSSFTTVFFWSQTRRFWIAVIARQGGCFGRFKDLKTSNPLV